MNCLYFYGKLFNEIKRAITPIGFDLRGARNIITNVYIAEITHMPIETPSSVTNAIEFCLKPIARLCIHFGIDHRTLSEMMKAAFVSVARDEFKVNGKSQTDSRIALLTGVHRKDVRRLQGRTPDKTTPRQQGLVANLIAHWLGTPALVDEHGMVKPIPRNPSENHPYSFITLASSLTNDIHPRALLDECVNRGIVEIDDDDMVHLIVESLVPDDDLDEKALFFGQTIHDHIAAAEHNLNGNQPPFLDRFVWHEGLSEDDTKVIATAARKAAMNALKQVNNHAVQLKQSNHENHTPADFRIHFGTFFYSTRTEKPAPQDNSVDH